MTSKGAKLIGFLRALVEFIKSYGDIAPSDGTNSGTGDPNHDENDQRNHSHNWKEDVYRIQSHHWVLIGLSLFLSEQLLSVLIGSFIALTGYLDNADQSSSEEALPPTEILDWIF